jgi:Raf kinase inhibitor-like YbhB/YbcL family protein
MRKLLCLCAGLVVLGIASPAWSFEISSPAVGADKKIPLKFTANGFGCHGQNISLPLVWTGVPAGAKSLTLTIFDPDAPTGSGFWHWLVVNLPASTRKLAANAGVKGNARLPRGTVQARNDAGTAAYFGPCPPKGDKPHRYVITIYAVKVPKLSVGPGTSGAVVGFMLHFNAIAKASVTYTYGR